MSSEVHLTRAQKWDLARLAVAAVASSVFFSLPMLLAQPRSAADAAQTPSVKVAEEIAVAGVSEPVTTANPPHAETSNPRRADIVAVVTSTESARITRPLLTPAAASEKPSGQPIQVRARVTPPPSAPTEPATLSRRLGRFLKGDGKYDPKPFPTVTTSGM